MVGSSSTVHAARSFGRLPASASRRPVVGDGRRHDDDVGVGSECERLALEVGGGRRLDDLDTGRCGHGEVRAEQRHVRTAPLRLGRERNTHASGRAVADEAHGVDRLARPSRGDEHALAPQLAAARRAALRRRGRSPRARPSARRRAHPLRSRPRRDRRARRRARGASRRLRASPDATTCAGSSPGRRAAVRGARAPPRSGRCRRSRARASRACSQCTAPRRGCLHESDGGRRPRPTAGARARGMSRR